MTSPLKVPVQMPKEKWISGHLTSFKQDPLAFLDQIQKEDTDIVRLRFGHQNIYHIKDPDILKEVLVTKADYFKKAKSFAVLKAFVGEGLLTSEGEVHKQQRRRMQPSFTESHLSSYVMVMEEETKEMMANWKLDTPFNIHTELMNVALGIICRTMFGTDVNKDYLTISQAIDEIMTTSTKRIRSLIKIPLSVPTKENKKYVQSILALENVISSIIQKRREQPTPTRTDLLSILMESRDKDGNVMSERQLRDEVMTIFLAGHETTANAMGWTMYHVATHPNVERKIMDEIQEVVGNSNLTYEHAKQLTYLKAAIHEAIRLHPPAWLFGREAKESITIGENWGLHKGDVVHISPYVMHRQKQYYQEPDTFVPERFLDDSLKHNPRFTYLPFGGGARSCIGNHFSIIEATVVLATIYRYNSINLDKNYPVIPNPLITLRPKEGIMVTVNDS
ncbi:cytochrome P450 [Pontibacillus salicampi]|uniref:Cytochrome P450 n=1 Tax=Pontibacillus salicampi TaxID=1449801 RepID=A0ABV6LKX1_9BACI